MRDSSQTPGGYSFLGMGELVEEEVIRTTPLHTLVENCATDTLLSPSSHEISAPDFSRSPIPSPVSPDSDYVRKSNSDYVIERTQSESVKSELPPSNHRVVQSSSQNRAFMNLLLKMMTRQRFRHRQMCRLQIATLPCRTYWMIH